MFRAESQPERASAGTAGLSSRRSSLDITRNAAGANCSTCWCSDAFAKWRPGRQVVGTSWRRSVHLRRGSSSRGRNSTSACGINHPGATQTRGRSTATHAGGADHNGDRECWADRPTYSVSRKIYHDSCTDKRGPEANGTTRERRRALRLSAIAR